MKKIQILLAAFIVIALGAFVLVPASSAAAAGALDAACGVDNSNSPNSKVCQNKDDSTDGFVNSLVNTLLYIVGAISVVAIIIGGVMFVTSGGSSANVAKAKNTVTYAVVGLVVSVLAYAIVNWVVKLFV